MAKANHPPPITLTLDRVSTVANIAEQDDRYIDSLDITAKLADVFQQALGFMSAHIVVHQRAQP